MALRLTAVALAALCASSMAAPCSDVFNAGVKSLRVSEVCDFMKTFETCVEALAPEETVAELFLLRKNQMRFGCTVSHVARRQENQNINLDSKPTINRQRRESVSVFNLNDDVAAAAKIAANTKKGVDQAKKDSDQAQIDINLIKQDMVRTNAATLAVARIDEQVKALDSLSATVEGLDSNIKGLTANLDKVRGDLEKSNTGVKADATKAMAALEAKLNGNVNAAIGAANDAKAAAAAATINSQNLPTGSVVQVVDRINENTGGDRCSNGYCTSVPHYGNNMGNYRKTVCYIEITAARDGSNFQFAGNQYLYTIGGSHFYVDYKRKVNNGAEKSLTQEMRKSSITDEISGGHPSRGLGIMVSPVFLDTKANAKKGQTVRYTLWVASWSSGRFYLHGYPNNNERSMNWYTLTEIACTSGQQC